MNATTPIFADHAEGGAHSAGVEWSRLPEANTILAGLRDHDVTIYRKLEIIRPDRLVFDARTDKGERAVDRLQKLHEAATTSLVGYGFEDFADHNHRKAWIDVYSSLPSVTDALEDRFSSDALRWAVVQESQAREAWNRAADVKREASHQIGGCGVSGVPPTCIECANTAKLVTGQRIYPHRRDLYSRHFYLCQCGAYCGTHKGTTRPLGYPCGPETRKARSAAHAAFDPLWRGKSAPMRRDEAYKWLAGKLGIPRGDCHIGMMNADLALRTAKIATRKYTQALGDAS